MHLKKTFPLLHNFTVRPDWKKSQLWAKNNTEYILQVRTKVIFFAPSTKFLERNGHSQPHIRATFNEYDADILPLNENFDAYVGRRMLFWQIVQVQEPAHLHFFTCNMPGANTH